MRSKISLDQLMEISPTAIVWMSVPIATIEPLYGQYSGISQLNQVYSPKDILNNFGCLVKEFFNFEA